MGLWSINSGKEGWGNGWGDEFSWILEWLKSISPGRFFYLYPSTHFLFCLWKRESLSFSLDTCMTIGGLHFPASPEAVGGSDVSKSWPMNVWEDGSPPWSRISSFPSSRLEGPEFPLSLLWLWTWFWWMWKLCRWGQQPRRWRSNKLKDMWILEWHHGTQLLC